MSNMNDGIMLDEVLDESQHDFDPGLTPEEEEEQERERQAIWNARIKPYRDIKNQIAEHDDLMAETLYEITLLQLGMEV